MNPTRLGRYDACVLLGSILFLSFNLWSLTTTPFLLGGDEQVFWTNAQRLLQGEIVYRDFYEFTPPGTDVVYLIAFKLLGSRIWAPNVVVLVLGTLLTWLCYRISHSIMRPAPAVLAAGLVLILDFGSWLDGTHHWFSVLSVLGAIAVLMPEGMRSRILVAGALCGLASFFTQTRGVAAAIGLVACLFWDGFRARSSWRPWLQQSGLLLSAFVVSWLVLSSYFLVKAGISRLWYFQVVHVLHYVANDWNILRVYEMEVRTWLLRYLLIYLMVPLVYVVGLWRAIRLSRQSAAVEARSVTLLAFVGASMFAEVSLSPNPFRLDCVALPAIPLGVWLVTGPGVVGTRWRQCAVTAVWLGLIGLGAHRIWYRNVARSVIEDLPAGRIAAMATTARKLDWIARRTQPGQYFCDASYGSVYLPLALRVPIFAALNDQTSPAFLDEDIRQLEARRVRYILWSPLDRPRFPKFVQFLTGHYQLVQEFADQDQIWELRAQGGSPGGS
jgi:hypothetical protein